MNKDITVNADKFDAVLKRMMDAKPLTKAEISAKIKAEKQAKAGAVHNMDNHLRTGRR